MIDPQPTNRHASVPSIANLVFAGEPPSSGRRVAVAGLVVALLYVALLTAVSSLSHSAEHGNTARATHIHDTLSIERALDLPSPPPPPSSSAKTVDRTMPARVAHAARSSPSTGRAAARAGQIVAASSAPADFSGLSFVVGAGATHVGGTTSTQGTSRAPVTDPVAGGAAPARDRSRTVTLDEAAWSCRWPAEADAQQVNEQTVVLRVTVRADGRAERADVLSDPGFGFGSTARTCALATRFEPARDQAGHPVTASSPPIRVHFFR